jgi:hypothetical protein
MIARSLVCFFEDELAREPFALRLPVIDLPLFMRSLFDLGQGRTGTVA